MSEHQVKVTYIFKKERNLPSHHLESSLGQLREVRKDRNNLSDLLSVRSGSSAGLCIAGGPGVALHSTGTSPSSRTLEGQKEPFSSSIWNRDSSKVDSDWLCGSYDLSLAKATASRCR